MRETEMTNEPCPDCQTPAGSDDGYTCPKHRWWKEPSATTLKPFNPRYASKSAEQAAAHLAEECAEVCQAFAKSQRWGWDSYNPELPEEQRITNMQWFLNEVRDVQRCIQKFREHCIEENILRDQMTGWDK